MVSRRTATRDPVMTTDLASAAVDELPAAVKGVSSRTTRYATAMQKVREEVGPGKWVPIATFAGRGGAKVVKRAIDNGERPVDGELGEWEVEARKNDAGGSVLWVKLAPSAKAPAKKAVSKKAVAKK